MVSWSDDSVGEESKRVPGGKREGGVGKQAGAEQRGRAGRGGAARPASQRQASLRPETAPATSWPAQHRPAPSRCLILSHRPPTQAHPAAHPGRPRAVSPGRSNTARSTALVNPGRSNPPAKLTTAAQACACTRGLAKSSMSDMTAGRILACCSSCRGKPGGEGRGGREGGREGGNSLCYLPQPACVLQAQAGWARVWLGGLGRLAGRRQAGRRACPSGVTAMRDRGAARPAPRPPCFLFWLPFCLPACPRLPAGRAPGRCTAGPAPGRMPSGPWGARQTRPAAGI